MNLKLSEIRKDDSAQPRLMLNTDHIKDLADSLIDGRDLTPVDVFFDGHSYWLADGFHRHSAYHRAKREEMPVTVHEGDLRQAVLWSITANAKHAVLKLTRDEKRQSVTRLLKDKEWGQWSDREIARRAGVSPSTVGTARKELGICPIGQIEEGDCKSLQSEDDGATGEISQSEERKVKRGDSEYTMQVKPKAETPSSTVMNYRPPLTPDEPEEDDRLEYDDSGEGDADNFEPDEFPTSALSKLMPPKLPAVDLRVKPEDPAKRRPFERVFTAAGALANTSDDLIVDALLSPENNMRQTKGSLEMEFQTVVDKIVRCLKRAEVEAKTMEVVG